MGRVGGGGDPVKVIDVCGKRATADCLATRGDVWGEYLGGKKVQTSKNFCLNACCVAALAPAESEMDFLRGGVTACDLVGTFFTLMIVDSQPFSLPQFDELGQSKSNGDS